MEKKTPRDSFLRKKKNASGGVEAKYLSCKECGIEFCTGDSCKMFDYDSFKRVIISTVQTTSEQVHEQIPQEKKTLKKKNLNKGSKLKTRANNMAATTKNTSMKNNEKIISVKTNKKNSNTQDLTNVISKENVREIKNITPKGSSQIKKQY